MNAGKTFSKRHVPIGRRERQSAIEENALRDDERVGT